MKKIGITTFYNAYNYGAFLQCFALQKTLEKKYNVSIIDHSNKKIEKDYKLIKTNSIKRVIKSLIFVQKNIKRRQSFKKCISKEIKLSSLSENYDIVIAGSDQIWNYELTGGFDDIFTLQHFKNIKKISYASSVGNEKLIESKKNEYRKIIEDIDCASVREESLKIELSKITPKKIKVCLDPTLLLPQKVWNQYTLKNSLKGKYIFSYFVGVTKENYIALNKISKKLGLKVLSYSENPKEKNILKKCYTDNPFEFISKIKHADYVFTSSFHGTVFSIIFNKQFVCMLPKTKSNRITNLLEKLGLSNRVIRNIDEIDSYDFSNKIDYKKVNEKLKELREDSKEWLINAIEETK